MLAWVLVGLLSVASAKYLLVETEGDNAADYHFRPPMDPPPINPGEDYKNSKGGRRKWSGRKGGDYHDGGEHSGDGSGDDDGEEAGDYHGVVQHPGEHFHNGEWHMPEDDGKGNKC